VGDGWAGGCSRGPREAGGPAPGRTRPEADVQRSPFRLSGTNSLPSRRPAESVPNSGTDSAGHPRRSESVPDSGTDSAGRRHPAESMPNSGTDSARPSRKRESVPEPPPGLAGPRSPLSWPPLPGRPWPAPRRAARGASRPAPGPAPARGRPRETPRSSEKALRPARPPSFLACPGWPGALLLSGVSRPAPGPAGPATRGGVASRARPRPPAPEDEPGAAQAPTITYSRPFALRTAAWVPKRTVSRASWRPISEISRYLPTASRARKRARRASASSALPRSRSTIARL